MRISLTQGIWSSSKAFLAKLKLLCDSKRVHENAALWILPHYVQESLTNALHSRMCADNQFESLVASLQNEQNRSCKLRHSHPEVVAYLLKKYATDQAIAECSPIFLWYTQ